MTVKQSDLGCKENQVRPTKQQKRRVDSHPQQEGTPGQREAGPGRARVSIKATRTCATLADHGNGVVMCKP